MVIPEELRIALYPLGILSTFAFTLRFLIQWLQSEQAHRSTVSRSFWWISLAGNASLLIHSLIQGQYFICLVQGINGVIAVRNLNLQWPFSFVLLQMGGIVVGITAFFYLFSHEAWFRTPIHAFQTGGISSSWALNLIGFIGVFLFASRFWVQWILTEKSHTSSLGLPFWWISLIGAFFSIFYFSLIQDYINLVGPLFGLIPYLRNLILMRQHG